MLDYFICLCFSRLKLIYISLDIYLFPAVLYNLIVSDGSFLFCRLSENVIARFIPIFVLNKVLGTARQNSNPFGSVLNIFVGMLA